MKKAAVARRVIIHIVVWTGILCLPLLMRPDVSGHPLPPLSPMPQAAPYSRGLFFLLHNLVLVGFFYLNYSLLVPRFLTIERRRWTYFIAILICFIIFQDLLMLYQHYFMPDQSGGGEEHFYQKMVFLNSTVVFGLVWAASSGIRLTAEWKKADDRRRESENARLNAELHQLKSQLHPHFLFNTLNGIYTLALSKNDAAPDAVMKLSHLLRYVLAESSSDFVPLARDLEHLQHFIALHQMRLTEKTPVHFQVEGEATKQQIAPLLFLPFVENAFKFGSSARELSPIEVNIKIRAHDLEFSCQNQVRSVDSDSTGIGITNTRRRLELLYKGNYTLDIFAQPGVFRVVLKIALAGSETF